MVWAAAAGAVITMFVAWLAREVVGPWFVRPAVKHARQEVVDLVTVIVLSPEVQADLRPIFEEVVASEVHVVILEQASQGRRIERVEAAIGDLTRLVRTRIEDDRRGMAGAGPAQEAPGAPRPAG